MMTEKDNPSNKIHSRRDILKTAGLIGGMFALGGACIGGELAFIVWDSNNQEKFAKSDHYRGIPLNEYAIGTFTISFDYPVTDNPITHPQMKFRTSHIDKVNGYDLNNHSDFFITNPGIVWGKNPNTLTDNAPWMVMNTKGNYDDGSSKVLYTFLSDRFTDKKHQRPVEFVALRTNADGVHVDKVTGKPVDYLGDISFQFEWPLGGPGL